MKKSLIHLPFRGRIKYEEAARLQDSIIKRLIDLKPAKPTSSLAARPLVLTMQFEPVYTTGRRERGLMSQAQRTKLRRGGEADVVETLRGGQTTFHGPGQLVAYPIIDLNATRNPMNGAKPLSPRCYVSILEDSLIDTLNVYGIDGMRTQHTGVFVRTREGVSQEAVEKIAALGIHVRRGITSHGISLNVNLDLSFFDDIIACGVPGMKTTSIAQQIDPSVGVDRVTRDFTASLARRLGLEAVEEMEIDAYMKEIGI